jgi:ribonuclease HI
MNRLKELLLELAGGTGFESAWSAAGYRTRDEAERALRDLAATLAEETRSVKAARGTIKASAVSEGELGLVIYVDGASRGNPGPASIAAVAQLETGEKLTSVSKLIGKATNNVAEYRAVIEGLRLARDLGAAKVEMRLDSELVVKQLNGEYRIKNTELQILAETAATEAGGFSVCTYVHIPREGNKEADRLANIALDRAGGKQKK